MKKILIGLVMMMATSAFARGYGMAGCGLGSMLLGDKKGMMQIFASTTNGTAGTQTFGISTGTSNCMDGSGRSAAIFIEANRVSLANDIARGQGETIESLAAMYGCKDAAAVSALLQKNYREIFPTSSVGAERINATIIDILSLEQVGSCEISV
jgi:hypothetical protein